MNGDPLRWRNEALAIWQAGVEAVRSDRLVRQWVRVDGPWLRVGDFATRWSELRRIVVVGAGKAGAGMAAGLEQALGPQLMERTQLTGWVNVPADCVRPLSRIHLHAARPPGVNEPTEEGVAGAEQILRLVSDAGPDDLCVCLLSGGGSALLPAPVPGISLADKQAITRLLSAAGANIQELNTVRKQLSRIKGGGLARACRAGTLVTLIISDVLGDPLDVIASGPTVPDASTPQDALEVLRRYGLDRHEEARPVVEYLQRAAARAEQQPPIGCRLVNLVIGNNATAVDAAGREAVRRGYSPILHAATQLEGWAEDVGRHLARQALAMRQRGDVDCLISGGEPVVKLVPLEQRGRGGRNQQLVLAALEWLLAHGDPHGILDRMALLSAGTDGEDGPTDAAGAVIDQPLVERWLAAQLSIADHLRRNNAYEFFQQLDGLIRTGPTHTNVCDIRVVVIGRR